MNWEVDFALKTEENIKMTFLPGKGPLSCVFTPEFKASEPSGALLSLEIFTESGWTFQFQAFDKKGKVIAHISSDNVCELPLSLPLSHAQKGQFFFKELLFSCDDACLESALQFLSRIEWQGKEMHE